MPNAAVFELAGAVVRHRAVYALAGIDITIRSGERVAVIGPSGAGKSSVIGLLNGTLMPSEGSARVFGIDTAAASARRLREMQSRLGTIHQRFDLVEQLRVVHNVNAGKLGRWPLWKAALSLLHPRELPDARLALQRV